jgi:heme oxygenase (biliverdin-IX-beta and delta-forming)
LKWNQLRVSGVLQSPNRVFTTASRIIFHDGCGRVDPIPGASDVLAPVPGIRDRLKQATAEAHRDLDAGLGVLDLNRLQGYRRFLEINAAALLPLESALETSGVAGIFADWPRRARRSAITADLLKVRGSALPLEGLPTLSRKTMFGALYVLEGSRLGAKFLLRTVAASADPVIPSATAYLNHGAGQHLWQSFLRALEREPFSLADEADVMMGAGLAFSMFARSADRA